MAPHQEQDKRKALSVSFGGKSHTIQIRGVPSTSPMQTTQNTQVPLANSWGRMSEKMKELEAEMQDLHRKIAIAMNGGLNDDEEFDEESPLSREIQMVPLPPNFKEPQMTPYDGITDPKYHLDELKELMKMKKVSCKARCQCFVITLKGFAYK
uniref:Uncharacterized protein n=1 Tax=Cannabis sativa TaxID=3483 RepID=A0A803NXH6_CANSA